LNIRYILKDYLLSSDTNLDSLDKISEALSDFPMIKKLSLKATST